MYDPHTKESRGFGFVMMVDADGAARAIAELNGKEFMGKIMTVAHVRSGSKAIPIVLVPFPRQMTDLVSIPSSHTPTGSSSSSQDPDPGKVLRASQDW